MRRIDQIKNEITELTDRRTRRWRELGKGEPATETIAELTARIDELWDELRSTRVVAVHGSRDDIRRRADRERRMEIELARPTVADVAAEAA